MKQTLGQKLLRTKTANKHEEAGSNGLARTMGLFPLTMIGVGATIGTGIFFTMAVAVPEAGPAVILSFLFAALAAGLTALCYAELAFRIPASGSSYSFAYATLGEFAAFIMAACLLLEYGLAASATAIGWSDYLNNFLVHVSPDLQMPTWLRTPMIVDGKNGVEFHPGQFNLPPVLLVIMCAFLLIRGTKESATTNAVMVLIKLAILLFFVVIAFSGFDAANFTPFFNSDNSEGKAGMAGVAAGAALVFFSFIGLDTVATAGDEVRDPTRNVPKGILLALGIVTVFYMLVAISAVGAQPAHMFKGQEAGLSVILENVTKSAWPAMVLSGGAIISVFSVTLVTIYGQTRILYAISRDGLIPKIFQRVSPTTLAPVSNTVIVSIVVGLVAALVDSNFLWDMVSMGTLTAFMVVSVAVPVIRLRQGEVSGKGFKVPFGPYLIPALSVLSCLYLMYGLSSTTYKVFGIVMGLALACYFLYGMRNSRLNNGV